MTRKFKVSIFLLLILLIIALISSGLEYKTINELKYETEILEKENNNLIKKIEIGQKEIENCSLQINETESEIKRLKIVRSANYYILGIDDSSGDGEVINFEVVIKNGSGGIFTNITGVAFESDMQESIYTALNVAKNVTGDNLTNCDVMISFLEPYKYTVYNSRMSGESSGVAICLAIISAINNQTISDDVLITGTIKEDGKIGAVLGLEKKVEAARKNGAKTVLVPMGMRISKEGIEIREVGSIDEAEKYVF